MNHRSIIFLVITILLVIASEIIGHENKVLSTVLGIAIIVSAIIGATAKESKLSKGYLIIITVIAALLLLYPYFF